MGKATGKKRKVPTTTETHAPNDTQQANAAFVRDFITHTETNTKAMVYRRESDILVKWIEEGGPGFEHGAARAIADCQLFWARLGEQRLIARYGERVAANTSGDGWTAQDALDELHYRKKMVPAAYWSVFESVARHNEPAGVAGSSFAKHSAQQIASAKTIVGFVASVLAMNLGY